MIDSAVAAALGPLVHTFDQLGVQYYLGGSMASSAHGIARASLDADVVVFLAPQHVDALVAALAEQYYIPVERLRSAVDARSSCNLIHLDTMFKVDLFMSKGRPFDLEAASRARARAFDDGPDAPTFSVASPEDTVLAKLEWFRAGGESSERQWWDILGVLRVTANPDLSYLHRWATELGVDDLLQRALVDAAA